MKSRSPKLSPLLEHICELRGGQCSVPDLHPKLVIPTFVIHCYACMPFSWAALYVSRASHGAIQHSSPYFLDQTTMFESYHLGIFSNVRVRWMVLILQSTFAPSTWRLRG
ncbi:hypothetical protein IFM89_017266 [Coptis chinensis]|uniref:Uncharacterized protein n=1 Tax=Coptis chinensis TaxID=261450 RepID=A0A835HFV6_9MAGN|nr:hypothetical protein IFM89_017266 [Coptis chinensis]